MTVIHKTPASVSQTTGGKYTSFNNLNNIKSVSDSTYAQTDLIGTKTDTSNTPATVNVSKLLAKLPTGAMVTRISVHYKHSKVAYNGANVNVLAPTISLMNGNTILKYTTGENMSEVGQAPTTSGVENTVTFDSHWNYDLINSNDFGVRISYPANANTNKGYVRLYYVEVIITYRTAEYGLQIQKLTGNYNKDTFEIEATISNPNNVYYKPTVELTIPTGFSLTEANATLTNTETGKYQWIPSIGHNKSSDSVKLTCYCNVTYPSGSTSVTKTFNVKELLNNSTQNLNLTITDKPSDVDPDTPGQGTPTTPAGQTANYDNIIHIPYDYSITSDEPNVVVTYDLSQFPSSLTSETILVDTTDSKFKFYDNGLYKSYLEWSYQDLVDAGGEIGLILIPVPGEKGLDTLQIVVDEGGEDEYYFLEQYVELVPQVTTPTCTVLRLSQEELNRLGDGYTYTLNTWFKENTTDGYVRDWGRNFRMAVFNNAIEDNITVISYVDEEGETQEIVHDSTDYDNLTMQEIVNNAEFVGNPVKAINTYEPMELEFRYNNDYPLYVLMIGDYPEATTQSSISYTEPQIIESTYYNDRMRNGVYPIPIDDMVLNDGSTAEVNINGLDTTDTVVFYNFPLAENYGTDTDNAIRGFQINGTIEQSTDNTILQATLVNHENKSHSRSIVLDTTTRQDNKRFQIGQVGDLWGFSTLDMVNLEDWEVHLAVANTLMPEEANINFGNVNLTIYNETIEHQNIRCYIEGEDLSYYGVFLTDVKIPEGLETEVKFLKVDGTDTNDAYRQNIEEKTITVDFELGDNCDLEGATLSLRELARLLTNKRDQYNRPIPKRVEFSIYPDVYWEYILKEPIDNDIDISSYTCKVKLVVPAGTSYDKENTVTSTTGYVSGLAAIRPIIQVSPTDQVFNITEKYSEQSFDMGYTNWQGKIVEIDCDNRRVYLKESEQDSTPIDISRYVDYNSDWFRLSGEYEFTTSGCVIRTIDYQERW